MNLPPISEDDSLRSDPGTRFDVVLTSGSTASWSNQAAFMSDAVVSAAAHQSLENAPLVIFATAGALLFLFMVRS